MSGVLKITSNEVHAMAIFIKSLTNSFSVTVTPLSLKHSTVFVVLLNFLEMHPHFPRLKVVKNRKISLFVSDQFLYSHNEALILVGVEIVRRTWILVNWWKLKRPSVAL